MGGNPVPIVQFQSTRSRRARLPWCRAFVVVIVVSIHALAKSATRDSMVETWTNIGFNPRAREERDPSKSPDYRHAKGFQSTRSRRARPAESRCNASPPQRFNPRAREERDAAILEHQGAHVWFQSTRSRRARPGREMLYRVTPVFQSTRSRRARRRTSKGCAKAAEVSIHALAKSATVSTNSISVPSLVSIHALAKSATLLLWRPG